MTVAAVRIETDGVGNYFDWEKYPSTGIDSYQLSAVYCNEFVTPPSSICTKLCQCLLQKYLQCN